MWGPYVVLSLSFLPPPPFSSPLSLSPSVSLLHDDGSDGRTRGAAAVGGKLLLGRSGTDYASSRSKLVASCHRSPHPPPAAVAVEKENGRRKKWRRDRMSCEPPHADLAAGLGQWITSVKNHQKKTTEIVILHRLNSLEFNISRIATEGGIHSHTLYWTYIWGIESALVPIF